MTHTSHRPGVTHLQLQMFLSHTAPCSFHCGLSIALNQWSCAILNSHLWEAFDLNRKMVGRGMRERTETHSTQRWSEKSLHSSCTSSVSTQKRHSVSLLPRTFRRNTQSKSFHTEGRGRGAMKEGRKRRLAQASVINSHFYRKSTGRWGSRRGEG